MLTTVRTMAVVLLALPAMTTITRAGETKTPVSDSVPCGTLQRFEGTVQIMDATRTHLVDPYVSVGIPCGGWILVKEGSVEFTHRQGYKFRLGHNTFVEVFDNEEGKQGTGQNHMVLYKGKVFGQVKKGMGEMTVATPNGLTRVKQGATLTIFSQWEEETQLVVFEHKASLENRFEPSRRMVVSAGEASSLNLKALRVIPSVPRALALGSLRERMVDIPLSENEKKYISRIANMRKNRAFAASWPKPDKRKERARKLASAEAAKAGLSGYERHRNSADDDVAYQHWVSSLVGGDDRAGEILFPRKRRQGKVKLINPKSDKAEIIRLQMKREKSKLIQELKRVGSSTH